MLINIPDTGSFFRERLKIVFMFQDKSHDKIYNDRASESKKRKIDKIHPHGGGSDAEFFSPPGTNAEGLLLKPLDNTSDHNTKI